MATQRRPPVPSRTRSLLFRNMGDEFVLKSGRSFVATAQDPPEDDPLECLAPTPTPAPAPSARGRYVAPPNLPKRPVVAPPPVAIPAEPRVAPAKTEKPARRPSPPPSPPPPPPPPPLQEPPAFSDTELLERAGQVVPPEEPIILLALSLKEYNDVYTAYNYFMRRRADTRERRLANGTTKGRPRKTKDVTISELNERIINRLV